MFVDLYNDGLIYRDKRLVNWDPKLKTAISDLEVEQQTIAGSFWHFRYPLEDGVTLADGRDYIEVATTAPKRCSPIWPWRFTRPTSATRASSAST